MAVTMQLVVWRAFRRPRCGGAAE